MLRCHFEVGEGLKGGGDGEGGIGGREIVNEKLIDCAGWVVT